MIKKLLLIFCISLLISISGMTLIWIAGIYLNCIFVSGCYQTFGAIELLGAINIKSALIKGALLALVFTFLAWINNK